jgi:hypothetical protein
MYYSRIYSIRKNESQQFHKAQLENKLKKMKVNNSTKPSSKKSLKSESQQFHND